MCLARFRRTAALPMLGISLLLALPAWGSDLEPVPPSPPERPGSTVVADTIDATDAAAAGQDGAAEGADLAEYAEDAPLAFASPGAADADTVTEARALMDAGRFMEAVSILGPLVEQDVIDANTLFLYGLAALEASQQEGVPEETRQALLDQAISSFHAMLVEAPGLVRVRLELARAFFLNGQDGLARYHFELVLAGDPPEAVAANVQRFLGEIRGRGRWSFRLGFALAPDSNIGGTSDERTIYIYNLPFQRDAEELTTSGIGVSVWGGAEYQVGMGEDFRLRAGAETARREYEGSEFDQFFLSGHLGPRWLIGSGTDASVLVSARQRWLGTVPDHRDLGGRLEVSHRLSRSVTVNGQASWHGRRYRTRTFLDGPVWDMSLRGAWVVMPTVRAELSGGYGRDRPTTEKWRSNTRWVGTGVSLILPYGFNASIGGEYRWTDYGMGWFPFIADGSAREDRTRSLRASVYNRGFTLYGFSPELVVVNEERESNAQAHGYERTRGELRMVRQF